MNWGFKNFKRYEFECKCGCCVLDYHEDNYLGMIFYFLQPLRDDIGKPIIVTSGIRCFTHNKNEGGAKYSYHTDYGDNKARRPSAVDFYVPGVSKGYIDFKIRQHTDVNFCGYKIYVNEAGLWLCHIDWRGVKARW